MGFGKKELSVYPVVEIPKLKNCFCLPYNFSNFTLLISKNGRS